jgi:hypothetical protein
MWHTYTPTSAYLETAAHVAPFVSVSPLRFDWFQCPVVASQAKLVTKGSFVIFGRRVYFDTPNYVFPPPSLGAI